MSPATQRKPAGGRPKRASAGGRGAVPGEGWKGEAGWAGVATGQSQAGQHQQERAVVLQ